MEGKKKIKNFKNERKESAIIYLVLRLLVIVCIIMQFISKNYSHVFLATFSLILFTIPTLLEKKLKLQIPSLLESIIYIFIFSSEILGEINNFYGIIPYWDTILHTLNGFLCAGIGLSLFDLLNTNSKKINLSPIYLIIVAFCFSMTIGILWEFFEYSADKFVHTDMQKDTIISDIYSVKLNPINENMAVDVENIKNTIIYTKDGDIYEIDGYLDIGLNDTMKDLIVNFVGAICFSIFGYLYIKNRDENSFVPGFLVTRKNSKKI